MATLQTVYLLPEKYAWIKTGPLWPSCGRGVNLRSLGPTIQARNESAVDERIEPLRHRCQEKCALEASDLWSYDDC